MEVAQQIVGRERRERVSQLAWCSERCFDSPVEIVRLISRGQLNRYAAHIRSSPLEKVGVRLAILGDANLRVSHTVLW